MGNSNGDVIPEVTNSEALIPEVTTEQMIPEVRLMVMKNSLRN